MKIRLNVDKRIDLERLAKTWVDRLLSEDVRIPQAAARAVQQYIRALTRSRFPPADMEVLHKYGCANTVQEISYSFRSEAETHATESWDRPRREREAFKVALVPALDVPQSYGPRVLYVLPTDPLKELHDAAHSAQEAYQELHEARLRPYRVLIKEANTLEDVEAVWPEAAQLRAKWGIKPELPSVLTADLRDQIVADVALIGPAEQAPESA